jgi:protein O-GlcNAc transferase
MADLKSAWKLHQEGRLDEAMAAYDALLIAQPSDPTLLHYAGVAAYQRGDLPLALDRLRDSVNRDATNADAWSNLGLVLMAIGHHVAAADVFGKALALAPAVSEIEANLASAQNAAGQSAAAEATARRIVAREPTFAKAWFILALALQPQGRMLEALEAASRAAGHAPDQEGYAGLKAQLENGIGAPEKARATLEKALARNPMSIALRYELANVLEYRIKDLPAAVAAYEQVLRLDPRHGPALSQCSFLKGRLADWNGRAALVERYRAAVAAGVPGLSPFALLSLPSTRAEQRRCAESWGAAVAGIAKVLARARVRRAGRLRIGYFSGDFHSHATAFLAAGLFEQHDRGRFEIIAYSTGPDDRTPMRARMVRAFDRFVDLSGRDPLSMAKAIAGDGIDILVDLKGHTQDALAIVLAQRPAPIQVHYLGYPGTIGSGLVDYLVGDTIVTPREHVADYAEALAILPGSYQVNDRARPVAETPARSALGLPADGFVFACFNQTYKLNPEVFDAWAEILRGVPSSVLWLLAKTADDPAIPNLRREAQARGVDPARLVFAPHRANPDYLALYRHAGLFLDTWPYNAHTTASDALWAGCPVLTVQGETFAGRVGASLLHAVGLPDLVTAAPDAFVQRAIELAGDAAAIAGYRAHLEGPGRDSALFDTVRTTRALEEAYLAMAAQYHAGERRSFRVDAIPIGAAP